MVLCHCHRRPFNGLYFLRSPNLLHESAQLGRRGLYCAFSSQSQWLRCLRLSLCDNTIHDLDNEVCLENGFIYACQLNFRIPQIFLLRRKKRLRFHYERISFLLQNEDFSAKKIGNRPRKR
jgi:hypothetical protein